MESSTHGAQCRCECEYACQEKERECETTEFNGGKDLKGAQLRCDRDSHSCRINNADVRCTTVRRSVVRVIVRRRKGL